MNEERNAQKNDKKKAEHIISKVRFRRRQTKERKKQIKNIIQTTSCKHIDK